MKISEISIYVIALMWFTFTAIAVNPTLGYIFNGLTVGAMLIYLFDTKKTIVLDKTGNTTSTILGSLTLYAIFIALSVLTVPIFKQINIGGIISLLGATTPVLASSKILNFISFGFFVPFIETMFFVRVTDYTASRFNVATNKKSLFTIAGIFLIFLFGFIFLLYHVEAKGLEDNASLLMTFLLMSVSLGASFWTGEAKQAVGLHIIANVLAQLVLFGLIFT